METPTAARFHEKPRLYGVSAPSILTQCREVESFTPIMSSTTRQSPWESRLVVGFGSSTTRQSSWESRLVVGFGSSTTRPSPWESRLVVGFGSSTTRQSHPGLNNVQQDPANVIRHHDPGQQMLAISIPKQHYLSKTLGKFTPQGQET